MPKKEILIEEKVQAGTGGEIDKLVEEIIASGDHDLAHAVETASAGLLVAKRLAEILFGADAANDREFVLSIHDVIGTSYCDD
jgi:hypothetical protein